MQQAEVEALPLAAFRLSRLIYPYKLGKPPERVVLVININQSVT
jgi:hypothetical protein